MSKNIKVLVVDDSALVRDILKDGLSSDPEIEVVATAEDPVEARGLIAQHKPDVLTLDVEMPKMNGLDFLKELMPQNPLPVVMVSAYTEKGRRITLDALEAGAVDFVTKRSMELDDGLGDLIDEICEKVKIASTVDVSHWKFKTELTDARLQAEEALNRAARKIIIIGASTGGPEAIRKVINRFPANMPGVVAAVHMPADYTQMYAERLNEVCAMEVREARNGDVIKRGTALIAPGGLQMTITSTRTDFRVFCFKGEKVSGHAPSIDVLMDSAAETVGPDTVGILMTGMGSDGAKGLLAMRNAGGKTIGQDEASSIVYGMPKVAFDMGAVEQQLALQDIAPSVMDLLTKS